LKGVIYHPIHFEPNTDIGKPSSDYQGTVTNPGVNQDDTTTERGSNDAVIFMNDSHFDGASDGNVDCKIRLLAKGCTFKNAYRNVRMWAAQDYFFQDCTFENNFASGQHLWISDPKARVYISRCVALRSSFSHSCRVARGNASGSAAADINVMV
jgi:hypothetical protein